MYAIYFIKEIMPVFQNLVQNCQLYQVYVLYEYGRFCQPRVQARQRVGDAAQMRGREYLTKLVMQAVLSILSPCW